MEGDPAQRRLYAARIRRSGAQGSFPDERKPCLQGDDDGASAGRLRDCGLYTRRGRDEGERSDRNGPDQGLPALFHDRKRRIGVKTLPVTFRFNASFPASVHAWCGAVWMLTTPARGYSLDDGGRTTAVAAGTGAKLAAGLSGSLGASMPAVVSMVCD